MHERLSFAAVNKRIIPKWGYRKRKISPRVYPEYNTRSFAFAQDDMVRRVRNERKRNVNYLDCHSSEARNLSLEYEICNLRF
jgi:hypothetical protein